jgi:hypothetical protein
MSALVKSVAFVHSLEDPLATQKAELCEDVFPDLSMTLERCTMQHCSRKLRSLPHKQCWNWKRRCSFARRKSSLSNGKITRVSSRLPFAQLDWVGHPFLEDSGVLLDHNFKRLAATRVGCRTDCKPQQPRPPLLVLLVAQNACERLQQPQHDAVNKRALTATKRIDLPTPGERRRWLKSANSCRALPASVHTNAGSDALKDEHNIQLTLL